MISDVLCDVCKGKIELDQDSIKIEIVQHKGHVERYYFVCPHCNKKYVCFYSDNQTKIWQSVKAVTKDEFLKKRLGLKIQDRMNKLKELYGVDNA